MDENYMRRRTNLHSANNRTSSPRKRWSIGLMGFQVIICLICIVAAIIIRFAGGSFYTLVKDNVSKALNKPITGSDVNEVFANIKKNLPDVSGIFDSGSSSGGGSSGSSSSGSSSSGGSSSSNTSGSSGSSGTSSKSSSSSPSSSSAPSSSSSSSAASGGPA